MVKVVLVCTSASELGNHPTGLWLEEAATPYYMFKDKGCTYDIGVYYYCVSVFFFGLLT